MIALPGDGVYAVVLGTMQDGGLPHAGCRCDNCRPAWEAPDQGRLVASLALVDRRQGETAVFLVDATPDIKHQLNRLAGLLGPHPDRPGRLRQPDGILLTHAHMGHIGGLPQLSQEAMFVRRLPVYGPPALLDQLQDMVLWRPLLDELDLRPLADSWPLPLTGRLAVTPLAVPHRDEWGCGTLAFRVDGPERSLLYLPDIDTWEDWPAAAAVLAGVDHALVDASFYSPAELGGRPPVAHPLVPDTLRRWGHLPLDLILTHLNHTNPILREGPERAAVRAAGARLAREEEIFRL